MGFAALLESGLEQSLAKGKVESYVSIQRIPQGRSILIHSEWFIGQQLFLPEGLYINDLIVRKCLGQNLQHCKLQIGNYDLQTSSD